MIPGAFVRPAHGGYPGLGAVTPEIADAIALLEQRIDSCDAMAKHNTDWADYARDRKRQLAILIDEFRAGRHRGFAFVRAMLKEAAR